MSFPNHPSPQPPSQPFLQGPFFDGDGGGFWDQFPTNYPSFQFNDDKPDFHAQSENGPPFKRPRNSGNNPSNFGSFPPSFDPRVNSPHPGSRGTSHIFYKTRMCTKFFQGNCKNGDHCTFAHGQHDLREPPPNWQELVREKEKDGGPANWNDDQRVIHKMKICKKFYNGEECPYGEKCNFLHERPNPSFPDDHQMFKTEVTRQRESSAISIGTRGPTIGYKTDADQLENNRSMSSNLDATRIKPVFWKTKLCSKWEITGHCPFGERCHFAHGQSELQGASGHVDVEGPVNSGPGPIQTKPVAVPVINASPTDALVGAPVNEEGEDPNISKWKLNKKINSIYADWIYDDLHLTTPQSFSSEAET